MSAANNIKLLADWPIVTSHHRCRFTNYRHPTLFMKLDVLCRIYSQQGRYYTSPTQYLSV